jgi:dipeptide transport system permease protein
MLFNSVRIVGNFLISFLVLTLFTFTLTQFFPNGSDFLFDPEQKQALFKQATLVVEQSQNNLIESYIQYLNNILYGNFGFSSVRGTPIFDDFFIYFPATIELAAAALLFALLFGLPIGMYAAKRKNQWQDKIIMSGTLVGYSMPIFWWAMLLVLLFSLILGITPVASRIGFEFDIPHVTGFLLIDTLISQQPYAYQAFISAVHHLILPSVVLGTVPLAVIARSTRSTMTDVLAKDYIRSAKARGISATKILWKYALRNATIPLLTALGLQISILLTGSLITETIFSWPGIGKWLLEAVYRRDFAVIHGGILAIATFIIMIQLFLELIRILVDPEARINQ